MIYSILNDLRNTNSTNDKISILKKNSKNELLKRILKMTYDKALFSYGIGKKILYKLNRDTNNSTYDLETALNVLEDKFSTREVTGNAAIEELEYLLSELSKEDSDIIFYVIERDLKINIGKTQINKVWKNLVIKPAYNRCDVYGEKTKKNINYPAILNKKADGTYREFNVDNGNVSCNSRSGETYEYPILFEKFENFPSNTYPCELTVILDDELFESIKVDLDKLDKKNGTNNVEVITNEFNKAKLSKEEYILPRAIGNGLINSDNPPHKNIVADLWDCVPLEEYKIASLKDRKTPCTIKYIDRWTNLCTILDSNKSSNIRLIESIFVNNLKEAIDQTAIWMKEGFEGAILKDYGMVYKDGTNKLQLKLKIAFNLDVRIVGFIEGTQGTKREETFASFIYETDDKQIRGSVAGIKDELLIEINQNREKYLNTIIEIEGNDLTKGRTNDYYAVSHPRFVEFRNDKDYTDDIKRALASLEMAKLFKNR